MTFRDVHFTSSRSYGKGGTLYMGTASVLNCYDSSFSSSIGGTGGAIHSEFQTIMTLQNTTFSNNKASYLGVIN
jgi:hypothetical protein